MENIRVSLRLRPLHIQEKEAGEENIWSICNGNTITLSKYFSDHSRVKKLNNYSKVAHTYDFCFSENHNNQFVYEMNVQNIVLSSLEGINGTIFMYGQTGSGKTYTTLGPEKNPPKIVEVKKDITSARKSYQSGDKIKRFSTQGGDTPTKRRNSLTHRKIETVNKNFGKRGSFIGFIQPENNKLNATVKTPRKREKSLTVNEGDNSTNINVMKKKSSNNKWEKSEELREFEFEKINQNSGILILGLKDIFEKIQNDFEKTYILRCSYMEIYNETIFDLLAPENELGNQLTLNEDTIKKEFIAKGLCEESISSISDVLEKLQRGEKNRHYAQTRMNHNSSRSHTIFRIVVKTVTNNFIRNFRKEYGYRNINNEELLNLCSKNEGIKSNVNLESMLLEGSLITEAQLNFVDLAGSEPVSNNYILLEETVSREKDYINEDVVKDRVKEGQHINKSLFFLTRVIYLKSTGNNQNSPLTKILKSALGGNSRTLVLLCITPSLNQYEQTMSTLRFGSNAKKITNDVQANIIRNKEDAALKIIFAEYEKKIKDFELMRIQEAEHRRILQNENDILKFKIKDLETKNKKYLEKIKRVEEKYKIFKQQNSQFTQILNELKKTKNLYQILNQKYNLLEKNFKKILDYISRLFENYLNQQFINLDLNKNINNIISKYNNLLKDFEKESSELCIYKKLFGLKTLNDNDLEALEIHFLNGLDVIKDEISTRKMQKMLDNISKSLKKDLGEDKIKENFKDFFKIESKNPDIDIKIGDFLRNEFKLLINLPNDLNENERKRYILKESETEKKKINSLFYLQIQKFDQKLNQLELEKDELDMEIDNIEVLKERDIESDNSDSFKNNNARIEDSNFTLQSSKNKIEKKLKDPSHFNQLFIKRKSKEKSDESASKNNSEREISYITDLNSLDNKKHSLESLNFKSFINEVESRNKSVNSFKENNSGEKYKKIPKIQSEKVINNEAFTLPPKILKRNKMKNNFLDLSEEDIMNKNHSINEIQKEYSQNSEISLSKDSK